MRRQAEYIEGAEAAENFKKLASALFGIKKDGRGQKKTKKRQPAKATARKSHGSGKG